MSGVAESWRRIDAWFAAHSPASLALLRGPASDEAVAAEAGWFHRP